MRPIIFSAVLILALYACGQTPKGDNLSRPENFSTKDTPTVYETISAKFCNCMTATMRDNKPSTTFDSCYKSVLAQYTDSLKHMGFDPSTQIGEVKLVNEVSGKLYFTCPDIYTLLQKERDEENSKKLLFKGVIVSQKQLLNGEIQIVMTNPKTNEKMTFMSTSFLNDPSKSDRNILSYELTVEYEIRHNANTNQDEYLIIDEAPVMGVSTQVVEPKK